MSLNKYFNNINTFPLIITLFRSIKNFTILLYPSNTNYRYTFPNKIFEYIQARLGLVSQDYTPESFAKTLDLLTPELINQFKINSDKAPKILNYENEQKIILSIIQNIF